MGVATPHVNRLPKPARRGAAKRAGWRGKRRLGDGGVARRSNYDRDAVPKRVGGNSTPHNSTAPRYWPARTAAMS